MEKVCRTLIFQSYTQSRIRQRGRASCTFLICRRKRGHARNPSRMELRIRSARTAHNCQPGIDPIDNSSQARILEEEPSEMEKLSLMNVSCADRVRAFLN